MKPILHFRIVCFVHTEFQIFVNVPWKTSLPYTSGGGGAGGGVAKGSSTWLLLLLVTFYPKPFRSSEGTALSQLALLGFVVRGWHPGAGIGE